MASAGESGGPGGRSWPWGICFFGWLRRPWIFGTCADVVVAAAKATAAKIASRFTTVLSIREKHAVDHRVTRRLTSSSTAHHDASSPEEVVDRTVDMAFPVCRWLSTLLAPKHTGPFACPRPPRSCRASTRGTVRRNGTFERLRAEERRRQRIERVGTRSSEMPGPATASGSRLCPFARRLLTAWN